MDSEIYVFIRLSLRSNVIPKQKMNPLNAFRPIAKAELKMDKDNYNFMFETL